jgi:hypothetical protein
LDVKFINSRPLYGTTDFATANFTLQGSYFAGEISPEVNKNK